MGQHGCNPTETLQHNRSGHRVLDYPRGDCETPTYQLNYLTHLRSPEAHRSNGPGDVRRLGRGG
eukprot:13069-Eustigmatos_ZCMA.PRE.1